MIHYYLNVLGKYASSQYWQGFAAAALAVFLSFMAPIWPFVFLAFVLVLADLFSGIQAAKKRGQKINSRGLFRSLEKFALYFVVITVAEHMRVIFFPPIPITQVVSFGICVTEFFSLVENVETVTGVNIIRRLKEIIPGLTPKEKD
jgi:phage-related holin